MRDTPDEAPGTEVPGRGKPSDPTRGDDDPAAPSLELEDVNRVVTSDESGEEESAGPDRPAAAH